jgi:negative regulator of flagellin synthesis FlgM
MEIQPISPQSIRSVPGDDAVREKPPVADPGGIQGRPASGSKEAGGTPTDTVEISEQAQEMARAHGAVQDAPDVRADRVAEITRHIEDGTYSVPPEALAAKLLGDSVILSEAKDP